MKNFTKMILTIGLLFFLAPQQAYSQTSCTSCTTTNCSSVNVSYTYNGSTVSYPNVPWVSGMNVRVAMLNAQALNSYTFTTTTYCPSGGFLMSFNGIYSDSNSYWALYVNGVFASYGMDFQQLNASDSVSWILTRVNKNNSDTSNYTLNNKDSIKKQKSQQLRMLELHLKNGIGRVEE